MFAKLHFLFIFILAGNLFAQSGLPHLSLSSKKIDFGKTYYLEVKSEKITFRNVGDTVLTIYHFDSLKPPFYGQFHYPDTLKKNDSVAYYIAYKPRTAGRDSQRVYLRADTRLSHSIGLLFDISYSMRYDMPNEPSVSRLEAARIAGRQFINSMIYTNDVQDEAAVFYFWEGFRVAQDFTTDKQKLINALPRRYGSATAFYDGCAKSINRMRNRPYVKVLIALTDGEDLDSWQHTPNSVIDLAKRYNVKIFTVGIGSRRFATSLRRIAEQTGGQYFDAMTTEDLNNIYFKIFNDLSKNVTLYFDITGTMPHPQLLMDCPTDTVPHLPADTLVYDVFLHDVKSEAAQGKDYELILNFNRTILYPLDKDFRYNNDGTVSFFGRVDSNLNISPIKSIKFLTLVGDAPCTDIRLEKIVWSDEYYGELQSSDLCEICASSCARDLRQIQTVGKNILEQNTPNPFNQSSSIDFIIENEDHYKIEVYDLFGNLLATLLDKNLTEGVYTVVFDRANLPAGTYFYSLISSRSRQTKRMIIIE
jgi:hypothetical protein